MADPRKEKEEKARRQLQDDLDWTESVLNNPDGKYKLKETDHRHQALPKPESPPKADPSPTPDPKKSS